jgi:hypothetical protein
MPSYSSGGVVATGDNPTEGRAAMAEKKKSVVGKVTDAVQGAAAAVVKAADEHVVKPVGKALGLSGEDKPAEGGQAEVKPAATPPAAPTAGPAQSAPKPTAPKASAAARSMMTKPVAGKKTGAAKATTKRVADAGKPKKPATKSGGSKGPRRGASKGR